MRKIIYLLAIFINIIQSLAQPRPQEPINKLYIVEGRTAKNKSQPVSNISNNAELKKLRAEISQLRKDRIGKREQIKLKEKLLEQERANSKKQIAKISQLEKEKIQLSDEVVELKNRIEALDDEFWLKLDALASQLEQAVIAIQSLQEENAYLRDIIDKQEDMMRNDFINTAERTLTIGGAKYKFDDFEFVISGFKPNSADIPLISEEQEAFLTRLMYQVNKAGVKLKITGTCRYDNMDKSMAKKVAYGRASNFRNYLINTFNFKDATISDDIERKIKCKTCNSVIITFE